MLDRVHLGAVGFNGGSHARIGDGQRAHRYVHRLSQIDPSKHDAGVGPGGTQCQFDTLPAVQTDTDRAGQGLKRSLFQHRLILVSLFTQKRRYLVIVHAA